MLVLGVVLFALAIGVSIMLHEAGHLLTAKAFGMKATEYFVGFGPRIFSFRRGETEYGLKAIPAGGYVKITGMTRLEELAPGDEKRAFFRQPAPQRAVVLVAGSLMHFLIALVVLYGIALFAGLPDNRPVVGDVSPCVVTGAQRAQQLAEQRAALTQAQRDAQTPAEASGCQPGDPVSPARAAGLRPGDEILAVGGTSVDTYQAAAEQLRAAGPGPLTLTVERDGVRREVPVTLAAVQRKATTGEVTTIGQLGITGAPLPDKEYGVLGAVPAAFGLMGQFFQGTYDAVLALPSKVGSLVTALTGGQRDPEGIISVVGAARLGGQAVQADQITAAFGVLASLNVFIGVFNLLPLLPLDGGHLAVLGFEKARSGIARRLGRRDPGSVDITKLLPVTYVVVLFFATFSLLAISADVVNPIANPFR